jgi:hypothetical protein
VGRTFIKAVRLPMRLTDVRAYRETSTEQSIA